MSEEPEKPPAAQADALWRSLPNHHAKAPYIAPPLTVSGFLGELFKVAGFVAMALGGLCTLIALDDWALLKVGLIMGIPGLALYALGRWMRRE